MVCSLGFILFWSCLVGGFSLHAKLANLTPFDIQSEIMYEIRDEELVTDCEIGFYDTLVSCQTNSHDTGL